MSLPSVVTTASLILGIAFAMGVGVAAQRGYDSRGALRTAPQIVRLMQQ